MTSVQKEWISKYFRITKKDRNCYKGIQEISESKYYNPRKGLLIPDNVVFTQFIQSYNNVNSVNPTRHRILELSWDETSIKIHKIRGFCRGNTIQCDNLDFVKMVREKGVGQEEDGEGKMFIWTFIEECEFDPDNQVVMPDYMFTNDIDSFVENDLFVDKFKNILRTVVKGSHLCKNTHSGYESYNCIFTDSNGKYNHIFYESDNLSCAGLHVTIYLTITDNIKDILVGSLHICNINEILRCNYKKNYFVPYFEN